MTKVFISYKREDRARVGPIAEGLRQAGLSVWMDVEVQGGAAWRQSITERLEAARCVVVVWSRDSVGPAGEFVHDEASRAKAQGVLLPVRIDRVSPPLGFGEIQSLDLVRWRGSPQALAFRDVVAAVNSVVDGEPRPRPRVPVRRRRISAALAGTAVILGVLGDVVGLQSAACRVPGVRSLCRVIGAGGVPTKEEQELWEARRPRDCDGLRQYLASYPTGAYAEEAQGMLDARKPQAIEEWTPAERRLAMTVERGEPHASEEAAMQEALARGARKAATVCSSWEAGEHRLCGSSPDVKEWNCSLRDSIGSQPAGTVCGFDGQAVCEVEVRRLTQTEVCP